jgi:hypothetical protein
MDLSLVAVLFFLVVVVACCLALLLLGGLLDGWFLWFASGLGCRLVVQSASPAFTFRTAFTKKPRNNSPNKNPHEIRQFTKKFAKTLQKFDSEKAIPPLYMELKIL